MNFKSIVPSVQKTFAKTKLRAIQHSPELLVGAGILGTLVAFGMAIKATTKLEDVLSDGADRIEQAEVVEVDDNGERITPKAESNKKLAKAYGTTVLEVARLYAPSAVVLGLSITAIVSSNNIQRKRNLALTAAYTALDNSFREYKQRVADKIGEESEKELRYGVRTEKIEEEHTDENGKTKKTKKDIKLINDEPGMYAKFFDESSRYWEKDAELNRIFLQHTERYLNDVLIRDGYLFLSDVYKALDIDETRASRTVGWIYDPSNKNLANRVDFGLYDTNRQKVRDFMNGIERVVLLDFNPDGVIINRAIFKGDIHE